MKRWVLLMAFVFVGCGGDNKLSTTGGTTGSTTGGTTGSTTGGTTGSTTGGTTGSTTGGAGSVGQVFPASNAWNQEVDGTHATVDAMSDQYIASIGVGVGLHPDFDAQGDGIPYVVVPKNQAEVPVTFVDYPDESDPGPYPIPDNAPVEDGGDGHVIVVDPGNGFLYELYQGMKVSGGWQASNGAKWNLQTGAPRPMGWTSADAAGLPIFPGLVRYDEVSAGAINHALRFTIDKSQKGYVAPASHAAGSCAINSACPPMGMRLRLKASVDISGYKDQPRVVLQALKTYGLIVADNGSNWYISGEPNANWNDDDMHTLGQIKGSDFEVISVGTITPE